MKTPYNTINEIIGVPCDTCNSAGFIIYSDNGCEIMGCDCAGKEDRFYSIFDGVEND